MKQLGGNKEGEDRDISRAVLGFRMMEKHKLWEENDTKRANLKGVITELDKEQVLLVQAAVRIRKDILIIVLMWKSKASQAAEGVDYSLSEVETLLDEATAAMS